MSLSRKDYHREYARKRRRQALKHYGDVCACCGEDNHEFLAFDHIAGGGNEHRKTINSGGAMVNWLFSNNFPETIRVLCANCNSALGAHGYCPHQN